MTGKHSSVQRRQTLKAYGFMTPALIIIILFTIIPIIGSLVLMFYDYSVLGQTKFVGLKNFVKAFHDRVFWISIKNSVIFVVVVPIIQILSILLAVLVNKKLPGIGIFRTLFYIPVVTSMVAVSIMWGFIFDTSGIINTALKEGEALPSVRSLAGELRISALTVKKAYDKLEEEGFVTTIHGKGTYVTASDKQLALEARQREAEADFEKAIDRALAMGMSREDILETVTLLLEEK